MSNKDVATKIPLYSVPPEHDTPEGAEYVRKAHEAAHETITFDSPAHGTQHVTHVDGIALDQPFVLPTPKLTQAQDSLARVEAAILQLSAEEQKEIAWVRERMQFYMDKVNASAKLAVIAISLEIAVSEGQ